MSPWLRVLCTLLCALRLVGSVSEPFGDFSNTLVATVLDPSSREVTRDCLTLLRSVRALGGSLREAALLVAVVLDDNETFVDDGSLYFNITEGKGLDWASSSLLEELAIDLGVTVAFVKPPLPTTALRERNLTFARTMNKFATFRYFLDSSYSYFMWLDADIIVLADPLPQLRLHPAEGQISCAPELYNYMKRFPIINESELVWNPQLPPFYALAEKVRTSHGLCNTGVLVLDRVSIRQFTGAMDEALAELTNPDPFLLADRFFDSLLFVYIVNKLRLQVRPFESGYTLNFMAFFEAEVLEETVLSRAALDGPPQAAWSEIDAAPVTFAHMLHTTEYYCYLTGGGSGCGCYVYMDPHPNKWNRSALLETLSRRVLPEQTCKTFAGSYPARRGEEEEVVADTSTGEVALSADGYIIGSSSCLRMAPPALSTVRATSRSAYIAIPAVVCCEPAAAGTNGAVRVSVRSPSFNATSASNSTADEHGCFHINPAISPGSFRSYRSTVELEVTLSYGEQTERSFFVTSFAVELLVTPLAPAAAFSVSANPLQTPKSIALASQLQLSELLNERLLVSGPGLVIGTESTKGRQAVLNLISSWEGDTLIILLRSDAPARGPESAKDQAAVYKAACLSAGRRCVLKYVPLSRSAPLTLLRALRHMRMSFAFVDVATEYSVQLPLLQSCYELLERGGVLLGSTLDKKVARGRGDVHRLMMRSVQDALSAGAAGAALMTYNEAGDDLCREHGDCSASYYFFRA